MPTAPITMFAEIVPLLMGAFCVTVMIVLPILLLVTFLKRSKRRETGMTGAEAELMQELYQGLSRLESRVESLETILLGKAPRGERK